MMFLCVMVEPVMAGESLFVWTTAQVRARPSVDSSRVRLLNRGSSVEVVARVGHWVELRDGFVHESLVGPTYVPEPGADGPMGTRGRVVGRSDEGLFELVDVSTGGAPGGMLCSTPFGPVMELNCLPPFSYGAGSTWEAGVSSLWERRGRDVQAFLSGCRRLEGHIVDPLRWVEADRVHVLTPDGPIEPVTVLRYNGETIWSAKEAFSRTALSGFLTDDDWLLVGVEERPLSGCCSTTVGLVRRLSRASSSLP